MSDIVLLSLLILAIMLSLWLSVSLFRIAIRAPSKSQMRLIRNSQAHTNSTLVFRDGKYCGGKAVINNVFKNLS